VALLVALDKPVEPGLAGLLCRVPGVAGVKVGLPAALRGGIGWARSVARECDGLRVVDFKLADISSVMASTVEPFLGHYDAFIAHSFVGVEGALDGLKSLLDSAGAKLVLVATMSHEGARDVYDPSLPLVERVVERVDPWGIVAPATRPGLVSRLRGRFPGKVILSPGVGAQGARPGAALCAGADYEIVGRSIMDTGDPVEAARLVAAAQERALASCGGGAVGGG